MIRIEVAGSEYFYVPAGWDEMPTECHDESNRPMLGSWASQMHAFAYMKQSSDTRLVFSPYRPGMRYGAYFVWQDGTNLDELDETVNCGDFVVDAFRYSYPCVYREHICIWCDTIHDAFVWTNDALIFVRDRDLLDWKWENVKTLQCPSCNRGLRAKVLKILKTEPR